MRQSLSARGGATAILLGWVGLVERHRGWVLLGVIVLSTLAGAYTQSHLRFNTSTSHLFSRDLPWRQAEARLDHVFPQLNHNLVIVVDAATPALADQAARRLGHALRNDKHFPYVYLGADEPFFRRNGLLFRSKSALDDLSRRLTLAQPFLGQLVRKPDLPGLLRVLERVFDHSGQAQSNTAFLPPFLNGMGDVFAAAAGGQTHYLAWQSLLGPRPEAAANRPHVLVVRPKLNFNAFLPATKALQTLHRLVGQLGLTPRHGVFVDVTGPVAFQHHERTSLMHDLPVFTALSLLMVAALLYIAMRAWLMVAAAVLTLIPGLLLTTAFAALAIGQFNLLSVAFVLLYIGLGIDHAIHLCMAYREARTKACAHGAALEYAVRQTGTSILSSALTTALALYVFVLTPFTALGHLGVIAGTGMLISVLLTFTLLPALLGCFQVAPGRIKPGITPSLPTAWQAWLGRRRYPILAVALGLGVLAALALPQLHFEIDPIKTRDANSEPVRTFKRLMRSAARPPLAISVPAPSAKAAQDIARRLEALPEVATTMRLASWIPSRQGPKLAVVSQMSLLLGTIAPPGFALQHADFAQQRRALGRFRHKLAQFQSGAQGPTAEAAQSLLSAIEKFLASSGQRISPAALRRLDTGLLAGLPNTLARLQQSLQARRITRDNLPAVLKRRWLSPAGVHRVAAYPRANLLNNQALENFTGAVGRVAPKATGPPVVMVRAAAIVTRAFFEALAYTAVLTLGVLWLTFRNFRDPLRVMLPLALAGLLTCATLVVIGAGFNFANIIALPLLLGAGIDYGIHMVGRSRKAAAQGRSLWATTTPKAVVYGALSTLIGFGNLAFTGHGAPASMGLLLALGLGFIVLADIALLPVMLGDYSPRNNNARI